MLSGSAALFLRTQPQYQYSAPQVFNQYARPSEHSHSAELPCHRSLTNIPFPQNTVTDQYSAPQVYNQYPLPSEHSRSANIPRPELEPISPSLRKQPQHRYSASRAWTHIPVPQDTVTVPIFRASMT